MNAVIGPSGCGKTTLVKAMLGIIPSEGKSFFEGEEIKSPDELVGRVGFAPQFTCAHPMLTVAEAVGGALEIAGVPKARRAERLAEILETEPDRVVQALNASRLPVSLNNLDRDGDEYVTDIPVDSVEERLSEIISLRQAVKDLEEEDKKLIILRYYKHMTQTQTAKVLNITQVQVSRREKKILANLRNSLAV